MISAVARPMPLATAVMTATLSVKRMVPPPGRRYSRAETSTGGQTMQLGIHLPHAGEQATPDKIRRAAMRAEDLGFADVWVSEHIIVPRAKELATLQNFSDGRLILGVGFGWLEAEFAALGAPFHERGRRTDEGIAMMRAVWTQTPVTFRSNYIPAEITEMTMQPLPVRPIPIWFGARSEAAYRRTVRIGDGWHGSQLTPEEAAPVVGRLRRDRPEPDFTISMRTHWNGKDLEELRERVAAFERVGVQHIMLAPVNREVDDWDAVIEGAGRLASRI